jgi:hypothetical protein
MKLNETNLLDAVKELRSKGYTEEYIPAKEHIDCAVSGKKLKPEELKIEEGYQFDITENTTDSQYLFTATEKSTGTKGLIIDLLGQHKFGETPVAGMLNVPLTMYKYDEGDIKYGLPKIYKDKFNENPERYELRIGYPDFPPCPFGNSFSMLGFDKDNKQYVWLVTSIIKDKRLNKSEFNQ